MLFQIVAVLSLAACLTVPPAAAFLGENIARQADQAYREGQYQAAYDGYQRLLDTGGADGHLLYNLGNAAYRLNHLGRAILHYERARLLLPRDADLTYNLAIAREQRRDAIPEPESLIDTAFFWLDSLTLPEVFRAFAALNLLFWGILVVRLFTRAEGTYYLLFILLAAWLLAGASFGIKWRQVHSDDRAVILLSEVSVLAGPDARDTVLFKLHEGAVVRVERAEDDWLLIRLHDGKRGWLRADGAEKVA